jgi:hypothetical protein
MITDEDVRIYQDIYYGHVKAALDGRFCMSKAEAKEVIKPALEKHGWTEKRYFDMAALDIMQRLSKFKSDKFIESGTEPNINIVDGNGIAISQLSVSSMPILRRIR